jgi:hypothetical protein
MTDSTDNTNAAPDDSWAEVIEDFAELQQAFQERAAENRARQAEADPPPGYEERVRLPNADYDPDVYLVVPHFSGDEQATVPRRPQASPPRFSAALSVTDDADQDAAGDRGGGPNSTYQVSCTIQNVGGTVSDATTYELFAHHQPPNGAFDTADDGVYESDLERTVFTGWCNLKSGPEQLYALGYIDSNPTPENILFRTQPDPDDGTLGHAVAADRTFSFEEFLYLPGRIRDLVTDQSAFTTDEFTVRLYYNPSDAVTTGSPYYVFPTRRSIDPTNTYLRTDDSDDAGDAQAIDLGQLDIPPGDTVRLARMGDYEKQGEGGRGMIGVFSGSDTLAASDQRNRVVDAIDAGSDIRTEETFRDGNPTDISEDFQIADPSGANPRVTIDVPPGATHLFVSPIDNFFEDNADPDNNYAVRITSRQHQADSLRQTVSTLENQAYLLAETDARIVTDRATRNVAEPFELVGDINNAELVDQQKVDIPPTGQRTATSTFTTPSDVAGPPITMTALYARVYSLAIPDTPPDWDRLDHTTTRFVSRSEFTWG